MKLHPTAAGLLACLLWSSSGLFTALAGRIPPFEIMTISWIGASCALGAFYARRRENPFASRYKPADFLFVLCGIGGYTVFYYFAFHFAPAFEANALNYLWPVFLIILLNAAERRFPAWNQAAGMAMGFAGGALLFAGAGGSAFHDINAGHYLAIGAALIWAVYSTFAQYRTYPGAIMLPVFMSCALLFVAGHMALETWVWPSRGEWLAILALGFCDVAFVLWDYAVRKGDRVFLTSISYFIPLFSTLLMIAGGYAAGSGTILLAAGLIIAGCITVNADAIRRALKN